MYLQSDTGLFVSSRLWTNCSKGIYFKHCVSSYNQDLDMASKKRNMRFQILLLPIRISMDHLSYYYKVWYRSAYILSSSLEVLGSQTNQLQIVRTGSSGNCVGCANQCRAVVVNNKHCELIRDCRLVNRLSLV